jgi:hypothetical protein
MSNQDVKQGMTEEERSGDQETDVMYAAAEEYLVKIREGAVNHEAGQTVLDQLDRAIAENARFRREDVMLSDLLAEAEKDLAEEGIEGSPPLVDEDGECTEWTLVSWIKELRDRRRMDVFRIVASTQGGDHCEGCEGCG